MRVGWKSARLADLVESIETVDPRKSPEGTFTYIDVSSISRTTFTVNEVSTLVGSEAPSRARRLVRAGDVIFATIRPTLQRIAQIPEELNEAICSTGYFVLRSKKGLLSRFLFYSLFTKEFSDSMESLQRGASYPAVSDSDVKNHVIAVPPLPEQKCIVAILDEAFAGIARAIANTEKNLANARELFESYLNSVFSQSGPGWAKKPLEKYSDFVSTGPFGSLLHKSDYVSDGVPLVNPINIVGEEIVPDDRKRISGEKKGELSSYVLGVGDIVIARRGEIGRCAVVTESEAGWICGTGCFFIRPSMAVNPLFLAHLLRSASYRNELERRSSGATMLNLSNKALANLEISIPKLDEQSKIVDGLAELSSLSRSVESICQRKLTALKELKQSLLQKAFSGELTAERAEHEVEATVA